MSDIAALTVQLVIILVRFKQGWMQGATCLQQKLSQKLGPSAPQVRSPEPALFCIFLVTTLPGGLPSLTAQQKYGLNFVSPGKLLEDCSKQKQGLNIKSQS